MTWGCPRDSVASLSPASLQPCRGPFLVPLRGALLRQAPGPSKHLGRPTGLSRGWGLRLVLGTQAVPGSQQGWGGAHGPRFCSVSDLSVSASDPQPETEDEKKRFEEGKGRYLQMKAKRQGKVEPQP